MDERSIALLFTEFAIGIVELSHLAEGKQGAMQLDTLRAGYVSVVYFDEREARAQFIENCEAKGYVVFNAEELA